MKKLPLIICMFLFIELYFLIRVGASLGALTTIALFVLTSFAGVALIRWQGAATAMAMSRQMAQGVMPKVDILKSLSVLFAGILLIIPGFFTDFMGVCLCVYGMLRQLFTSATGISSAHTQYRHDERQRYTQADTSDSGASGAQSSRAEPSGTRSSGTTIDGEYKREDD